MFLPLKGRNDMCSLGPAISCDCVAERPCRGKDEDSLMPLINQ